MPMTPLSVEQMAWADEIERRILALLTTQPASRHTDLEYCRLLRLAPRGFGNAQADLVERKSLERWESA